MSDARAFTDRSPMQTALVRFLLTAPGPEAAFARQAAGRDPRAGRARLEDAGAAHPARVRTSHREAAAR